MDVDNTTWGNWTNSGDVDLSAYKSSSTYIAYEYFGSSSSGSTWEIDNITINEGSTPPPTIDTVSVYDIQYTTDPNGNSNYVSQQIITGGIVTAVGLIVLFSLVQEVVLGWYLCVYKRLCCEYW